MKRLAPAVVVLVLLVALALLLGGGDAGSESIEPDAEASARPAAPPPPPPSRIAPGRVSGEVLLGGQGAAKAAVTLRAGAATLTAFALDDGHFLFDGVPAGEFFVSAVAGDSASDVVGPFALEPGGAVEGLVLDLAPAATLEGTVVDTLGHAPIAGAFVTAPSGRARTGADGHFTVRGATGQVWVEATAPGYLSRIEWVAVEKGRAAGRFELALTPVSRLSGTVLEGGRTVAGASVWAEIAVGARRGERSTMVLTDKDGHFELECTSGVLVPMAATSRGARIRGKELRLGLGEKRADLLLEAAEAAPVDATVTRDGQPLSGASVALLDSGSEELVASSVTGPLGRFVVPALQAGRYVVQVGLGSFRALAGPFEQTGSGATWTIALKGGAVLEGEVRPAIAGARVRWRSGDWTGPPAATTTDADGRFRFEGVPPGLLSVDAEGPAGAATARARAGEHVVLTLSKGLVWVRVSDASGALVSDAVLMARSLTTGVVRRQLLIAPDGLSRFEAPPGPWELVAEAPGRGRSQPRRVELGEGEQRVELSLAATLSVHGVIRESRSRVPVSGAQIVAIDSSDVSHERVTVLTDARGAYSFPSVSKSAGLLVRRDGFKPGWRVVAEADASGNMDIDILADAKTASPGAELQSFEGVGMVLDGRSGRILVSAVNEGSPAERAGVLQGDVVLSVDGAPASLPIEAVVQRIRGPAGTPVDIIFERAGQPLELVLRRRVLHF